MQAKGQGEGTDTASHDEGSGGHEKALRPELGGESKSPKRDHESDMPDIDTDEDFQEHALDTTKTAQRVVAMDRVDKDVLPDF